MSTLRSFVFVFCSLGFVQNVQAKPDEIIFLILVDAMRPDHMGSYGYDKPTTPNLDALDENGICYT